MSHLASRTVDDQRVYVAIKPLKDLDKLLQVLKSVASGAEADLLAGWARYFRLSIHAIPAIEAVHAVQLITARWGLDATAHSPFAQEVPYVNLEPTRFCLCPLTLLATLEELCPRQQDFAVMTHRQFFCCWSRCF